MLVHVPVLASPHPTHLVAADVAPEVVVLEAVAKTT